MERNIQFIVKGNTNKWMLWLQIDGTKVLLIDTLKSQEEVKSFIQRICDKTINLLE